MPYTSEQAELARLAIPVSHQRFSLESLLNNTYSVNLNLDPASNLDSWKETEAEANLVATVLEATSILVRKMLLKVSPLAGAEYVMFGPDLDSVSDESCVIKLGAGQSYLVEAPAGSWFDISTWYCLATAAGPIKFSFLYI